MRRRAHGGRAWLAAVGLAATVGALAACSAAPPRTAQSAVRTAGPGGASPSGSISPTPTPSPVPRYEGAPASLAARALPPGPGLVHAEIFYAGVDVGAAGSSGRRVVYPAITLDERAGQAVVHLKLPFFDCVGRTAPSSRNFADCTQRVVEYGDLESPQVQVSVDAAGMVTVVGDFTTYVYGPGIDPGGPEPAHWTDGHVYRVTATISPAQPLGAAPSGGRSYVARGTVQVGSGGAREDAGYPNRLVLPAAS